MWRSDPKQSGLGGAIGDIGVHAFNLLEYVSGRQVVEICADLSKVVPGRSLDDDCNVLLKLDNGAPGVLFVSQIAAGDRNDLQLHLYGEKGGLHWWQENPNHLDLNWIGKPSQTLHAGGDYLSPSTRAEFRLPVGHPEGLIEAFANIYRDFGNAVRARFSDPAAQLTDLVPGILEGVRSMSFVERAVTNSRKGWVFTMKTVKGPAIFLAQFAADQKPFNKLEDIARWAAGLGFKGIQIPSWDARLFDLKLAAESQDYCDQILGMLHGLGLQLTELSTHLQGQLVAVHPAYDLAV